MVDVPIRRMTLEGPPVSEQSQQIFGPFGGRVEGIAQLPHAIVVGYEGGLDVTFAPVMSELRERRDGD